jgi:hypothetical protein
MDEGEHINGKHENAYCGNTKSGNWTLGEQPAVEIEQNEPTM